MSDEAVVRIGMVLQGVLTQVAMDVGVERDVEFAVKTTVVRRGRQCLHLRPTLGHRELAWYEGK